MGFLSGVLSNIQSHLGQHKDTLNTAIESLKQNKHAGKKGFNEAIGEVVKGVGEYNDAVMKSNKKVSEPMTLILSQVNEEFKRSVAEILPQETLTTVKDSDVSRAVDLINEKLKQCQQNADSFNGTLKFDKHNKTMLNLINDLNPNLVLRVKNSLSNVKHESERLKALSGKEKDDLRDIMHHIRGILRECASCVNVKIKNDVENLADYLKGKVDEILKSLERIGSKLMNHIIELGRWFETANSIIKVAETKIALLLQEADGSNKNQIETAATLIVAETEVVSGAVEEAKNQVKDLVTDAKNKVYELQTAVGRDLNKIKKRIKSGLSVYVENARRHMQDIIRQVGENSRTNKSGIMKYWESLKGDITELATGMLTTRQEESLVDIDEKLQDYATSFQNLETIVKSWIEDILKSETVKGALVRYVEDNKGSKGGRLKDTYAETVKADDGKMYYNALNTKIVTKIKEELNRHGVPQASAEVTRLIQQATTVKNSDGKIKSNFQAAKKGIDTFLTALERGPIAAGIYEFAKGIAQRIETDGGDGILMRPTSSTGDNTLNFAIEYTIVSLYAKARQAAADIDWLIGDKDNQAKIGNLNKAIENATKIKEHVDAGNASNGRKIQAALNALKSPITLLNVALSKEPTDALNIQLPDDTNYESTGLGSPIGFDTLETSFKKGGLVGTGKSKKEELNEAILAIHSEVTNALQPIDKAYSNLMVHASDVNSYLTSLCHAIKQAAGDLNPDGLKNKLKDLTDLINKTTAEIDGKTYKGLNKIHTDLGELRNALLNDPIQKVQQFIKRGVTLVKAQIVTDLHRSVDNEVESAIEKLTTQARKHYVTTVKGLLTSFTENVEKDLHGLADEIQKDGTVGYKGFMRKMESKFITTVNGIDKVDPKTFTTEHSPLSKSVEILGNAFKLLFTDLKTQPWFKSDHGVIKPVQHALGILLDKLQQAKHFNSTFSDNHQNLMSKLQAIAPTKFDGHSTFLVDSFKVGFNGLAKELGKAYVNKYSGKTFGDLANNSDADKAELTKEGRDCAKTCLTLLEILNEDLSYLKDQCETKWASKKIYSGSSLGSFLAKCGYEVSKAKQDGELKNKTDFTGSSIHGKLVGSTYGFVYHQKEDTKFQLENLYLHLNNFYQVGHIAASLSTRRPCSIYEMLGWLTSLLHHPVYFELTTNDFADLFDKPKKKAGDNAAVDDITFEEPGSLLLSAYPQNLTPGDLHDAVMHVTSLAPVILTTIVGYGDEYTTYAVDYHSNAAGFAIPSSASSCLNMLLELMRRLFPVFRFLHSRCSNLASEYGWYHCAYGSNVESAGWQCNDHSKTDVDCVPRSPLMSYLRDSLPGHLPHQLTSVDCKSECKTCPKSTPGMPCITPLGFKGFSGSKKTGKDISNVLTKFFDKGVASCLLSLSPRPPSSLPEHYAFALCFVKGWSFGSSNGLKKVIDTSIGDVSMELHKTPNELTDALMNAYGSTHTTYPDKPHLPAYADLSSLAVAKPCNVKDVNCAPYLASLFCDAYQFYAVKQSNLYLSWAVYLPWSFWVSLNNMYNAFCSIACPDWGCRSCLRGDNCKRGKHGVIEDENKPNPICQCPSLVQCKGVCPTLYQYGFSFGDAYVLNNDKSLKTCSDFCSQLKKVLNSEYFKKLFEKCDEFLWTIREPFTYLVLALWSLSLFYLICVMVGRLDVLHIRSHLRIPSSHKIAAQSLLAAAQVGRLAKISYLQP